uniref:Uncharacterized protein n=1 Tax=Arundo donax TaxID=35708 RepID=A0A0A9ED65_ARUDO
MRLHLHLGKCKMRRPSLHWRQFSKIFLYIQLFAMRLLKPLEPLAWKKVFLCWRRF